MSQKQERAATVLRLLKQYIVEPKMALDYSNTIELLFAVILSAQCTDKMVNRVTKDLFVKYPTLDAYVQADLEEFREDIRSIGFYRNKGKNILVTAKILQEEHDGEVPRTMPELMALPGVGRKTANVVLGNAFGIAEGIAVDTHVKRLARLFGLSDQTDPKKIELDLMPLVPKEDWVNFTHRMILYGREYCPAHCQHGDCPIYNALKK